MTKLTIADRTFQEVYDRLGVEYNNCIPREALHQAVYFDIVERCATIASAYSPGHTDIGDIIRKNMGLN